MRAAVTPRRPPCSRRLTPADLARLPEAARLARGYLGKITADPMFGQALGRDGTQGSNEWAVSGTHTVDGRPLVANDPHLSLGEPSTFYPIGLQAPGMDVEGEGFAGTPGVIIGHNSQISWGATTNPMDVTDTYQEKVVTDPSSPSGLSTVYKGADEHVLAIPETFRYNVGGQLVTATAADGVPPATLIVPRRNNGPIVQLDLAHQSALSVQYTGFSATFELETFLRWDRAHNLQQFERGLQYFDVGSQNWAYADVRGNVAYFTSAEMPVREDLQAGTVERAAALVHPQRPGRQRVAAGGASAAASGDPVRDLPGCARCRTSSTRRPAGSPTPTTTRQAPRSTTIR